MFYDKIRECDEAVYEHFHSISLNVMKQKKVIYGSECDEIFKNILLLLLRRYPRRRDISMAKDSLDLSVIAMATER